MLKISELLKSKIQNLNVAADTRNQGTVVSVTDGICRIHGLSDVMQGEMIEFPAPREGDPVTYDIILRILADEVEHEEDLVALKEDLDFMLMKRR